MNKRKPKNCPICKKSFEPLQSMQRVCGPSCALTFNREKDTANRVKADRARTRERKRALMTLSDHHKQTQAIFNKYIRLRDQKRGLPCISCQRHHTGQYHAGHYRSVGANPELRYLEDNCWRQCSVCNNHLSSNAINFRINLVKLIGLERVEELEGPHDPLQLRIDDLIAIKAKYAEKVKQLKKEINQAL